MFFSLRRGTLITGLIVFVCAVAAGTASAATPTLSIAQCGTANSGVQFVVNGSGFAPDTAVDVQITTSETGAQANPNYILPAGAPPNPFIGAAALLAADGTFSFSYNTGWGQILPASIAVYTIDGLGNNLTLLSTTSVTLATACADGTTLAGNKTSLPSQPDDCAYRWKQYGIFKSQGDCMSYLTTRTKNQPALLP